MKIMIINPDCGVTEEAMALRCRILQQYVAQDTELYMACPQNSGVEINSALDVALAAPEIVNIAVDAQNAGFDAVVLYCFSDPAIEACREALRIPVIGGAQAACLSALNVCRSFGVMLADELRLPEKKRFLRTLGVDPSCIAQIAAADMRGVDPWQNRELALARLAERGQQMIAAGAEAIVLGCLSFLGLAQPLAEVLGVPVIDPAVAAVCTAESTVRQNLLTSKISYPLLLHKKPGSMPGFSYICTKQLFMIKFN